MRYRTFIEARKFVRKLGLKNELEWRNYFKSGKKPADIPADPYNAYKGKGWTSIGDWLGTGSIAPQKRDFLPFKEALAAFETILKEGQSLSKEDFFEGKSNMPVRLEVKISYLSEG